MQLKTDLCRKLGIEYPVLQASIGSLSNPKLAAAVSNAGGLGAVAMTGFGYDGTKARLRETSDLTNQGIVANLLLSYDISSELEALLETPPKVVSFFWGDVTPYVKRVHACGSLVMVSVGSVAEARQAVDAGADIIVAQGWEAGGHVRGTVSTLALVPAVVDAVGAVPVVAAGGISDGRGLAAALCLGAQAAWIGTRFLGAKEADMHPHYRSRVFAADASDTYYSKLYDGTWPDAPGRVLRNSTIDAWEKDGCPPPGDRPGEDDVIATDQSGQEIMRYDAAVMRSDFAGDIEAAPLWAGQGVGLVSKEESAAEIVQSLVSEAGAVLSGKL